MKLLLTLGGITDNLLKEDGYPVGYVLLAKYEIFLNGLLQTPRATHFLSSVVDFCKLLRKYDIRGQSLTMRTLLSRTMCHLL